MPQFVHLHVHSCFSYLDGASDLESLVRRAAELGMPALALTDHNSLAAAVKFSEICAGFGVRPILGCEVTMQDDSHLTLLATNTRGYANLCHLVSLGFARGGRLQPSLAWQELPAHAEGLLCLSGCAKSLSSRHLRAGKVDQARRVLTKLATWFGKSNFYIELIQDFTPGSLNRCQQLVELAGQLGVEVVATNNVHYVEKERFPVHDVLRCIGAGITLADDAHRARPFNDELYFKSATEMTALFAWCPMAIDNAGRIAERCHEALAHYDQITPRLPDLPEGETPETFLRSLALTGAPRYYPNLTPAISVRLEFELRVVSELGYANFVLLAYDAACEARRCGIWFQLRGSGGCSLLLRVIGVSNVDPIERNLPFARFLSPGKVPDIDLDYAHDRRDEMLIYFREKYGVEHVAMCCTFHCYWARGAIRDIGKVLGLPPDLLEVLRTCVSGYVAADEIAEAFAKHPELKGREAELARCQLLVELAGQIAGFPRHLATHSSGMVVTHMPIAKIAPTTPSARGILPIVTLDKDDVETIGGIKLDMLCLRIMSAIADAVSLTQQRHPDFDYEGISLDIDKDEEVFQLIRSGNAFGVFQLESPAQMHLALMLQPQLYEDLTASIALIRPGPISSGMVRKFVNARNGYSRIEILHPLLLPILERTYGCVVFQEQVIQLIAVMTGWSEPAADRFRKALTRHHRMGSMDDAKRQFVEAALSHLADSLSRRSADLLFEEVKGWAGLGFVEAHAASFAIIAVKSASLSVHQPAEFFAGLLNHQPMGYWPPNSLVAEARRRGINTYLVDINKSGDKCVVEAEEDGRSAIRLGLRLVSGIRTADIEAIIRARSGGVFQSLLDFCIRAPIPQDAVESLILSGAFDDLHYHHRRGLIWRLDDTLALARGLRSEAGDVEQLRLELAQSNTTPIAWELEDLSPWDKLMWEWRITGVCAASHPLAWMREALNAQRIISAIDAEGQPHGARVTVAGLNVRPRRPPSKKGGRHLFTSIEDETGVVQAAFYGEAIERCTAAILLSPVIVATGTIKRVGPGINFEVESVEPLDITKMIQTSMADDRLLTAPPERSAAAR